MPAEEQTKRVGAHQLVFEQDLVLVRVRGDYNLPDAQQVGDELAALMGRQGRVYILVDLTQAGTIPPESRRFLAEWNKQYTLGGVANFGGGAAIRLLSTLLMNAYRLIRPEGAPLVYVGSEAEARAWVAAQRQQDHRRDRPTRPVQ